MAVVPIALYAVSALLIAYAWLLYPLLLRQFARRALMPGPLPDTGAPPPVTIILAAHNEAAHIGERITNLLALDYPAECLNVLVGIDGSSDQTAELAAEAARKHDWIRVHDFPERRGKVAVLKDLVRLADSPLLVFTDANTFFRPDALRKLVRHFADNRVGGVCGRLVLSNLPLEDTDASHEEGFYWKWETTLKEQESRLDSCLGANGAIFCIRRELFWCALPDNTMVDDFVIGMKVREQGLRMLYDPSAVAVEEIPDVRHEWVRRVRIGAGDYQALVFCRRCLAPQYGYFSWTFWSHKVLRWFTPHLAILLLLAVLWMVTLPDSALRIFGKMNLLGLLLVCLAAVGGRLARDSAGVPARLLRLVSHFVSMQLALVFGFVRFCRGGMRGHWTRTPRRESTG